MKILKRSQRPRPRLSIVLVDWSVRESFHLLTYLSRQAVSRDDFEVLAIEYYARQSEALRPHLSQVDTWALLEMPSQCYYHKHLMYNAGIVLARGDVVVDAGAIARHLRWLVTAGVLPPIELRVIRSETEARDAGERIQQRSAEPTVIGRLCFARYHGLFGPIDPAGRVVVV